MRALVLGLGLALLTMASASGAPTAQTFTAAGSVFLLSADGNRVAVAVNAKCADIQIWKPGGSATTVKTDVDCPGAGFLEGVTELALGGQRVIWEETNGGNNLEEIVETATVSHPTEHDVSYVESGDGAGQDPGGDYTGHLLADGSLLTYTGWTECDPYLTEDEGSYATPCVATQPEFYDGAIHELAGGVDKVVKTGPGALFPIWVDGGRILVRSNIDSTLTLLRGNGDVLHTFDIGTSYTNAMFQGSTLVALRPTALDTYDTSTGALVRVFHLHKIARKLTDFQSGIAVLVSGRTIHLLRVDTGKGASVTVPGSGEVLAQLEPSGLFYASNNKVTFLPMAAVLAKFS